MPYSAKKKKTEDKEKPNVFDEKDEALRKCQDWFDVDRNAKWDYTKEMEENYKLFRGDHWDLTGNDGTPLRTERQKKARPNAVENITFALVEGLVAEFSEDVEIVDYPVEKNDDEVARKMTQLKKFIAYKNRVSAEREGWLRNFFLYGTAVWHIFWDPFWEGGRGPNRWSGDIRWKSLHPQAFFPDARCRDSLEDGRRVHKAYYRTQEEIKERYDVDVEADIIRNDMLIGEEYEGTDIMFDQGEEQVLLVETWYKGEPLFLDKDEENQGAGMHIIWWAGDGNPTYLKHANYVYHEPGETPLFPFIVRQRYPRENSIWGFGEAHFIKQPQIVLNKSAEMILEGHMHDAIGQTFYEENALNKKQKKMVEDYGTMPGMWIPCKSIHGIKREYSRGVPPSLQQEPARLQKMIESIIGRFDMSQGRTPGSVTAFRALDLLASRAQVRLRSAEKSMTTAYEDAGNYINELIYRFYEEKRVYRILGTETGEREEQYMDPSTRQIFNGQEARDKFGEDISETGLLSAPGRDTGPTYDEFHPEEAKRAYVYETGDVIPMEEFSPYEDWQEGQEYEIYCPQLDVICKVSSTLPTDRMFFMEVAKELYGGELIDPETFWYVLSYGKFPPFEELMEKERERMAMMQEQQQQEAAMQGQEEGQPAQAEQAGGDVVEQVRQALEADPELLREYASLDEQGQTEVLADIMQRTGQS